MYFEQFGSGGGRPRTPPVHVSAGKAPASDVFGPESTTRCSGPVEVRLAPARRMRRALDRPANQATQGALEDSPSTPASLPPG